AMLIAETGGINAMIVDSTALPEHAVRDILASAFQSAGQRCSALRMLYVQKDVEQKVLTMLTGAMRELKVGRPWELATDVGPVIDDDALEGILAYCAKMEAEGRLIAKLEAPAGGRFVPPHILRVSGIEEIEREVFGPVLHVATFEADEIDRVVAAINARGYGLTFGLHTRIDARVQQILDGIHAGNVYVNRNQIGAVVGAQPFGGEGLSGTGPKAGGPFYLKRFRKRAAAIAEASPPPLTPAHKGEGSLKMPAPSLSWDDTRAATFRGNAETSTTASSVRDGGTVAFPDPGGWPRRADRIAILRRHLRGRAAEAIAAAAALDPGPFDLPGPTGEANSLMLVPRGRVLCLGPGADTLLAQVVLALAAGNAVVAVAPGARAMLQPLAGKDLPLAIHESVLDPADLAQVDCDVVAASADDEALRAYRGAVGARTGPK